MRAGQHGTLQLLREGRCGIESTRQRGAIGVHVLDGLARHAGVHGRLCDERRDIGQQARVERGRDDVLRTKLHLHAVVGGGHLVRHILARQHGERIGAGDLHFHVHAAGADVERTPEQIGEGQHVVDLVRIVAAAGGHDGVGADTIDFFRGDLGVGVGHGEDDGARRHGLDEIRRQRTLGGNPDEHVGTLQGVGEGAVRGVDGVGRFPLVHVLGPSAPEHALAVNGDDVLVFHAHGLHQPQRGDASGTRAVQNHLHFADLAARDLAGVDQAGRADDRRTVLVVMKHRDVQQVLQFRLDAETVRALDVLQIDAAVGDADVLDHRDDLVDVGAAHLHVDGVDVGEALEQHPLAFHHRLGRQRPQIAKAQDRGAVRDYRHQIALGGVFVRQLWIGGDRQHRHSDARRIGQAEVALGRHRFGGLDADLARRRVAVEVQRLFIGKGAFFNLIHGSPARPPGCKSVRRRQPIGPS